MPQISINSPVGAITVFAFEDQIVALDWGFVDEVESTPVLEEAQKQLTAYFAGRLHSFDLPLPTNFETGINIITGKFGTIRIMNQPPLESPVLGLSLSPGSYAVEYITSKGETKVQDIQVTEPGVTFVLK